MKKSFFLEDEMKPSVAGWRLKPAEGVVEAVNT